MEHRTGRLETVPSRGAAAEFGAAVSMNGVIFSYDGPNRRSLGVIRDLSLSFDYGQTIGLVGRNASGKTTLLNLIRGALVPQAGSVSVAGRTVSVDGILVRVPCVSLVSQRPDVGLAPTMTVFENFVLSLRPLATDIRPAYTSNLRRACTALVGRAGLALEKRLDEQTRFLSGGQQQGLSLLLALHSQEHVLLMDEPTASLDAVSARDLFSLATEEARLTNAVTVIVSHRLRDLIGMCTRIIILRHGTIARDLLKGGPGWDEGSLMSELIME